MATNGQLILRGNHDKLMATNGQLILRGNHDKLMATNGQLISRGNHDKLMATNGRLISRGNHDKLMATNGQLYIAVHWTIIIKMPPNINLMASNGQLKMDAINFPCCKCGIIIPPGNHGKSKETYTTWKNAINMSG